MLEAYHPPAVEASWDAWWTASGFYSCDPAAAAAAAPEDKFVMVIPPPNVTGSLHLGHALMASIEDALVRWHRMSGKHVMWLPGTDHAGIATQSVVERRLLRDRGVTRHDLGREAFLKEVWAWKEQYGSRITKQMRCLGVSVDWSRERFTMDDQLNKAVKEAFFRMHRGGLVKRCAFAVCSPHPLSVLCPSSLCFSPAAVLHRPRRSTACSSTCSQQQPLGELVVRPVHGTVQH